MIQNKGKIELTNWEIVSVNPNDKLWDWKDLFCLWGVSIQSIIAFSLISSLYLIYDLNISIVLLGCLLGTFFVNILGSFLIGFLVSSLENKIPYDNFIKYFLIIGVLGSFTTFSAFSIEVVELYNNNKILLCK